VQNMLLAPPALGLGATLTTLYLQFEKEAEAALGLPSGVHSYARLPDGPGLGQSVVLRFQMSFMEIDGVSIIGIRDALSRLNAAALGLWRAKEAQHKDAFLTVA